MNESLIPPDELLFDGTTTRDAFINGGPGFLWNSLVARGRLKATDSVLDIGFGNGKHARVLTEFLKPGSSYCGFDIVREGVLWCQQQYVEYPQFRFDLADVYSDWYNPTSKTMPEKYVFPYPDSCFDFAFAASLFTHLEPSATANYLHQVARVLKPGGRLLITCFIVNASNGGRHALNVQDRQFQRASKVHHVIDPAKPSRGVAYDEEALRSMVIDAGLLVAELTFGTWANGIDTLGALQDSIVAIKPH